MPGGVGVVVRGLPRRVEEDIEANDRRYGFTRFGGRSELDGPHEVEREALELLGVVTVSVSRDHSGLVDVARLVDDDPENHPCGTPIGGIRVGRVSMELRVDRRWDESWGAVRRRLRAYRCTSGDACRPHQAHGEAMQKQEALSAAAEAGGADARRARTTLVPVRARQHV